MSARKTTQQFISEAAISHKGTYDYSLVNYQTAFTKIKIICSTHGIFEQTPHDHLRPRGCPQCANDIRRIKTGKIKKFSLNQFIEKANKIHKNYYTYNDAQYNGMSNHITITCPVHGFFSQSAGSHIEGYGCPRCGKGNRSKVEDNWLDYHHILKKFRQYYLKISGNKFFADGFKLESNTVYEFYGDFWHGNPKIYNAKEIHPLLNVSFGYLYEKTLHREQLILKNGYNLVTIWEHDWKSSKIM